jgi:hypothetical protein
VKKFFLATAAVLALASPALAATDYPAVSQGVFGADPGQEGTIDGCKNYAINVFSKTSGHDIKLTKNAVWAVVDFEDHAYTASIWCKNDHGVVAFMVAGRAKWHECDLRKSDEDLEGTAGRRGRHSRKQSVQEFGVDHGGIL